MQFLYGIKMNETFFYTSGLAVYNSVRSTIIYEPFEIKEYKWKSTDLVPDQTEEELIELNEYMKEYE